MLNRRPCKGLRQGSCPVGRRVGLRLLETLQVRFRLPRLVVARGGELVTPALLPLHRHGVFPVCSLHQRIRPFTVLSGRLPWPLLTSPRASVAVADDLLGIVPRPEETSLGKALIFPPARPDLPGRCPNDYRASPFPAGLPHRTGLLSGFCSSAPDFAAGFLPTPPRGDAVAFG